MIYPVVLTIILTAFDSPDNPMIACTYGKLKRGMAMDFFSDSKIITAVRNEDTFNKCLKSNCKVVFLLFGTILTVSDYVRKLKEHNKTVFVHLDLIEGLSSSRSSVDYIDKMTQADGIISIKQSLLKYAKTLGFITVLRVFMLDSKSIESLEKIDSDPSVDIIEMMPGVTLTILCNEIAGSKKTIIAGGLIRSGDDVTRILRSGASAISTSDSRLWE